ncbi:MAG: sodium:proton antiporter [Hyphomicrobiales bacterium]|nr:sodium:proton antiporter [Hyphomicrobiales bacterium]MCP5371298.1 sodium:proton antiporter [Hyphomicrobiales bacterium]
MLVTLFEALPFGGAPMQVGQAIAGRALEDTGATNIVSAVLLAYRGLDTLGEVAILFVAATAAGLVLGGAGRAEAQGTPAGFILRAAAALLFPFLLVLGAYIVIHGHLTPGGGFQGGAILAAAFFVPLLAHPASPVNHGVATVVEAFAGAVFVVIGLAGLVGGGAFLVPLLGAGTPGDLFSAGSLPLLYLAIGLKVGSELAGLMARIAAAGDPARQGGKA